MAKSLKSWCRMPDSNGRPSVYKTADICPRCGGIISQYYLITMGCDCKRAAQPALDAPERWSCDVTDGGTEESK
jgi:hypothetical protein